MAPLVFVCLMFTTQIVYAQASSVTTSYNDISRTGLYPETQLNPTNVTPATFGKLNTWEVPGSIYTQPLYVSGLQIPNKGKTNIVYIATTLNSVYAFDADNLTPNASPLWATPLGNPAPPPVDNTIGRSGKVADNWCSILSPRLGVLSTPVIDLQKQEMYVIATEINSPGGPPHPVPPHILKLYVLNIVTGAKLRSVEISAAVDGNSTLDQQDPSYTHLWPAVDGKIHFNPYRQVNRPGLLLHKGVLYMAFGSLCDIPTYHGWVMAYNPSTLQQLAAFATTPNTTISACAANGNDCGSHGGIWQSGRGIAADEDSVYVANGNGSLVGTLQSTEGRSFSDSVIRLSLNTLQVQEFFTPWNQSYTSSSANDLDNGTAGTILSHDSSGNTVVFTGGKGGKIYTLWKGLFPGFGDALTHRTIGTLTCDGMTLPEPAPDKSRDLYPAQGLFVGNPTFIPNWYLTDDPAGCCPRLYIPHVHQIVIWPAHDQKPLRLYVWPEVSTLKMFQLQQDGRFPFLWRNNSDTRQQGYYGLASAQSEQGLTPGRHPGGALSLSTDGKQGIIWATHACDWHDTALHDKCGQVGEKTKPPGISIGAVQPGILRAFDATDDGMYLKELWNSNSTMDPYDKVRHLGKFTPPTIANGKVFIVDLPDLPDPKKKKRSELGQLHVYGLKDRCAMLREEATRLNKDLNEAGQQLHAQQGMQHHMTEQLVTTLRAQRVDNDNKARFYRCPL